MSSRYDVCSPGKAYDAGGCTASFSPTDHNGSHCVELTVIARDLKFSY
jgi:hypothetical protein